MPKKVRPVPKEYHTVTPSLTQEDAGRTIAFCKQAFGAKERMRITGPGGKIMHAEIQIGDSIVMLTERSNATSLSRGAISRTSDMRSAGMT